MDTTQLVLNCGTLAVLLLGAALDFQIRRIPNLLTFGGALAGFLFNLVAFRGSGALTSLEGWLLGVVLLAIPFASRAIGGGDVKLLAAVGAWLGPHGALLTFAFAAVIGGVVALAMLIHRGLLLAIAQQLVRIAQTFPVLPLGRVGMAATAFVPSWLLVQDRQFSLKAQATTRFAYGPALALGGILAVLLG